MGDAADMALEWAFEQESDFYEWEAQGCDLADGYERGFVDEGGYVSPPSAPIPQSVFHEPKRKPSFNARRGESNFEKDPLFYHTEVHGKKVDTTPYAIDFNIGGITYRFPKKYCRNVSDTKMHIWSPFLAARLKGLPIKESLTKFEQNWANDAYQYHVHNDISNEGVVDFVVQDLSDFEEETDLDNLIGAGQKTKKNKKNSSWHTETDEFGGF